MDDPKDTMLSEISQAQKSKYCMTSVLGMESKKAKLIEAKSRRAVTREAGQVASHRIQNFSYTGEISSGNLLYIIMSIVNNNTLHT